MKKEKKKNGFFTEFKNFITKGNVLDMAVGVIVGGAFTAIVNALSNNILKPIINLIITMIVGKDSLSEIYTFLKWVPDSADPTKVDLTQSIYIDWGSFINAIINFLLIAFVLFLIVRTINKMHESAEKAKTDFHSTKKEAIREYRKKGMSKSEAIGQYEKDLEKEKAAKEEEEKKAKEEAEALAKEEAEKAYENTKLLKEIRDALLNK